LVETLNPQPRNQFTSAWQIPDITDAQPGVQRHVGNRSSKIIHG